MADQVDKIVLTTTRIAGGGDRYHVPSMRFENSQKRNIENTVKSAAGENLCVHALLPHVITAKESDFPMVEAFKKAIGELKRMGSMADKVVVELKGFGELKGEHREKFDNLVEILRIEGYSVPSI